MISIIGRKRVKVESTEEIRLFQKDKKGDENNASNTIYLP